MVEKVYLNYLTPQQLHRLRAAAEPIGDAFDGFGAYQVGSSLSRPDFRDVDVRIIIDDDRFVSLFGERLDQVPGRCTALWMLMSVMISKELSEATGLNVDCQIQAFTYANSSHKDERRDPLMLPPYIKSETSTD